MEALHRPFAPTNTNRYGDINVPRINIVEPAKLGGANRGLIEQYSAWEHAWSDAYGRDKGLGGMLQSASCFKNRCMPPSSCYSMTNFRMSHMKSETGFGLFGSWSGSPQFLKKIVCLEPIFSGLKQYNESGWAGTDRGAHWISLGGLDFTL